MKISDQIMVKVERIETDELNFKRCLLARVCPKCGERSLVRKSYEDGGKQYKCTECSFIYTC